MYDPKRHNYSNKDIDLIVSSNIREYDIKAAGFNMLISANVLTKDQINFLSSLDKKRRNKKIGLMQKHNKELTKIINKRLEYYRERFIRENDIKQENIISVKKDALFLVNTKITNDKFENVEFKKKNKYSSFYRLGGLELYYSKLNNIIDIKGLGDSIIKNNESNTDLHKEYIIKFLKKIFALNEVSNKSACIYLKKFADKYRKKELEFGYYREFNNESKFRLNEFKLGASDLALDNIESLDHINIAYNYINIIVELIKLIY